MSIQLELCIQNTKGLHARAASALSELCSQFDSTISFKKADAPKAKSIDGKSILSIMLLAAPAGTKILASIKGPDEEAASKAIEQVFLNGFGEV